MKFGKFLLGQQNEWTVSSPHHVNYKALKRIIAGLDLNNGLSPGLDNLAAVKTAFFFRLERELEKVRNVFPCFASFLGCPSQMTFGLHRQWF